MRVSVSARSDDDDDDDDGHGGGQATAALVRALGRVLDAEPELGGSRRFGNTTVVVESLESGSGGRTARAEVAVAVATGARRWWCMRSGGRWWMGRRGRRRRGG